METLRHFWWQRKLLDRLQILLTSVYITYSISTFFPWVLLWKFLQPSSSSIFKTHLLLLKAKQKNNHTWLFFCSAFKGFPNCWEFMTSNAVIYLVSFLVIKIPIVCLYIIQMSIFQTFVQFFSSAWIFSFWFFSIFLLCL